MGRDESWWRSHIGIIWKAEMDTFDKVWSRKSSSRQLGQVLGCRNLTTWSRQTTKSRVNLPELSLSKDLEGLQDW